MLKEKKLYNKILLMFGILAPMPIINVYSITVYVWGILLIGFLAIGKWIYEGKIKLSNKLDKTLGMVIITWLISYLICTLRMPLKWKSGIGSSFIQLIFLIIVYIFFAEREKVECLKYYIKGIYISSIIQMFWGYAQIILDRLGIDLNTRVFVNFFHMMADSASQYQFGKLKVSGLCWNAGNFAPLITFGYVYTDNIYLKFAFFILSFLSGSRTLMLGIILCTIIQLIFQHRRDDKLTVKKVSLLLGAVLIVGLIIVTNLQMIIEKISEIMQLLDILNRIKFEGSASTHFYYLTSIPTITLKNGWISNLFGYGPGCSGYPQSVLMHFYANSEKWTIECDYVNQLWSYGYIGFIIYYYWYLKNALRTMHIDKKYIILFIGFLFEGLFYNITFNWMQFLLISIFLLEKNNINIFKLFTSKKQKGETLK